MKPLESCTIPETEAFGSPSLMDRMLNAALSSLPAPEVWAADVYVSTSMMMIVEMWAWVVAVLAFMDAPLRIDIGEL